MNYRTYNNATQPPTASQLSKEYMGEIRKSLDHMEKMLSKNQSHHHSFNSSRVNPQDQKKHYFFIKDFENERLTVDITIQQQPKNSRTQYNHTFFEQSRQSPSQNKYFQYNNYFSERPPKKESAIERKWINSRNLNFQNQLNNIHSDSKQQPTITKQSRKLEEETYQLPNDNQTSNFNIYANQMMSKHSQYEQQNKQQQILTSRKESQSNIEMQNSIEQPTQFNKFISPSRLSAKNQQYSSIITESLSIKQPTNTFMLSSSDLKYQPVNSFKRVQHSNYESQKQPSTLKKTFDKTQSKTLNNQSISEEFKYRSSRRNADQLLTARKKNITRKIQHEEQQSNIPSDAEITFGFASSGSRSRTQQIQQPHKLVVNKLQPQKSIFRKSNVLKQDEPVTHQMNRIELNPQSYLKKANKFIKSQIQIKKQRIRSSKPSKDANHNKVLLLNKIQQRQKSNPLKTRLTRRYQEMHGSLSPRWKNVSDRLYNNSRSKSPCPRYQKFQQMSQRDLFRQKVKKEYNFIDKYLTDNQIDDIHYRLQRSHIPESYWLRQVFHEARKRNNYCKHCL